MHSVSAFLHGIYDIMVLHKNNLLLKVNYCNIFGQYKKNVVFLQKIRLTKYESPVKIEPLK